MIAVAIIAVGLALLIFGAPLFVALGAATAACFLFVGKFPISMMASQMFSTSDREVLLVLPFFGLAYTLMTAGSSSRRIVDFIRALVGWLPGGMALASIAVCILFSALSGFSPAAIVAVGGLMYPGLVKSGFPEKFSIGLVTTAGSLGILVPPSIVVLIFGIIGEVNIEDLFVASLAPLVIISVLFSIYSVWMAKRCRVAREPLRVKEVTVSFISGFWAIILPAIIIGCIYMGLLNMNQAAATAAVYALVVECIVYRTVKLRQLPSVFREASVLSGTLLIIISLMFALNWFFTVQGVSQQVTEFITAHFKSKLLFLLAVNLLLLFLGGMMDNLSAMFITIPLLLPAAVAMGINPVHFGVIYIVNFEIGCLTPPVGFNLFTSGVVFRKPVYAILRATLPFLAMMLAVLALITYVPDICLWTVKFLHP